MPYTGEGFKIEIPSKWNPSKEIEYPGQLLRYEDNFDATSNVSVMVTPTDKKSITDYGSPEEFLSQVSALFIQQQQQKSNQMGINTADVIMYLVSLCRSIVSLESKLSLAKQPLRLFPFHELAFSKLLMEMNGGKLYICKAQAGDKRWFKGARKFVENAATSFSVA
ncbi:unnamed protein product [Microthlaspi erraticum]|uniref:PsbP C-terminal domain-containing protein n=1 Tax=Microthlaspi erraticum TaxID=1685480 RepID=A0A6D2J8K1_9BRAS|nr:unnamed protein product [Microthlaspi erraticum]